MTDRDGGPGQRVPRPRRDRTTLVMVLLVVLAAGATTIPRTDRVAAVSGHPASGHAHGPAALRLGSTSARVVEAAAGRAMASYAARDTSGRRGAGPRAVAHRAGGAIVDASVQTGSAQLFRTGHVAAEPTMGIDEQGRVYVYALSAPPAGAPGGWGGGRVLLTRDGSSFEDVSPRNPDGTHVHQESRDPYLHVDAVTGKVFATDLSMPCTLFSSSADPSGGEWSTQTAGCNQTDHQTIFTGPAPAGTPQPAGYPHVVYWCAINGGANAGGSTVTSCDKSLDGGATFAPTGEFPFVASPTYGDGHLGIPGLCGGASGHGFVAPDGTVLLPRGVCEQPWLAISRNQGASWTRVQVADNGMNTMYDATPDHEAGVVADADGNVYYVWVARDRLPYLAVSRDGGTSWSEPMMIGHPGLTQSALPSIALGPDGRVAVAYVGSTNAPGRPFPDDSQCHFLDHPETWLLSCDVAPAGYAEATWNGYITVTDDPLAAAPTFVSAAVNDPASPLWRGQCGPIRCGALYDFIDVAVNPVDSSAWAVFVDACTDDGTCAAAGEGVVGRLD